MIAEQVLTAITARGLVHDATDIGYVTASIGAACMMPMAEEPVERLTALADAALYAAKRAGRNRVHAVESSAAALTHQDWGVTGG
jgi:diguanylate cyclase (GGDEF)-like protein